MGRSMLTQSLYTYKTQKFMGIKEDVKEMNEMIMQGKAMEAFEKFYADDCTMQENSEEPRVGKDACRKFEENVYGEC